MSAQVFASSSHHGAAASWSAIIAGAFVAVSSSLILLTLGSGLGFSSVSPWPGAGATAAALTITAAIWLIVTQWVSAALGGYIAGRLRTRWLGTHAHEVFFRDTAHGLITWSVASVFVAALLASTLWSALSGGAHAVAGAAQAVGGVTQAGGSTDAAGAVSRAAPNRDSGAAYATDRLLRPAPGASTPGASAQSGPDPRIEVGHIMAHAAMTGEVSTEDRTYLADLVAAHTAIAPADAQKRVDDFLAGAQEGENKARAAADAARKSAAEAAIYTALSLLIGAFIASVAAALGGRLRDQV